MDFEEKLAEGAVIEPSDELSEEYRTLVSRIVQFTANSEIMGNMSERPLLQQAPTFHRKLALTAKLQDEVGHALMQYRICEDLGQDRWDMLEDLANGDASYGSSMQFPIEDWFDLTAFTCFTDGAAMILQHSLLKTNYGPYRRVMQRICREEEFHMRHGHDLLQRYATGTPEQQERMQAAVDTWWPRGMLFFGPTDEHRSPASRRMHELGIRTKTNDELRQDFLEYWVPKVRAVGLEVPDDRLAYDEETEAWDYTPPSMDDLNEIRHEGGPMHEERIGVLRNYFEDNTWVRDTLRRYHAAQNRSPTSPATGTASD
ncbi:MAG: Phenylacetic acid catabolic protein [Halobacteriales archaeon]